RAPAPHPPPDVPRSRPRRHHRGPPRRRPGRIPRPGARPSRAGSSCLRTGVRLHGVLVGPGGSPLDACRDRLSTGDGRDRRGRPGRAPPRAGRVPACGRAGARRDAPVRRPGARGTSRRTDPGRVLRVSGLRPPRVPSTARDGTVPHPAPGTIPPAAVKDGPPAGPVLEDEAVPSLPEPPSLLGSSRGALPTRTGPRRLGQLADRSRSARARGPPPARHYDIPVTGDWEE